MYTFLESQDLVKTKINKALNKIFVLLSVLESTQQSYYPANIYTPKSNQRNTRKRCEICLKAVASRLSVVFIVNFEHGPPLFLLSLLLTLNK